jgi:ABC-type nitrate/sulfonate/bicarbonate transport system substrate-binding protein
MNLRRATCLVYIFIACLSIATAKVSAQDRFADLVGNIRVAPVAANKTVEVPFITWGGDVATFMANGDLKTKSGSTYNKLQLDMQLVNGDNFVEQVQKYLSGKSPFLRGTMHMLGMANEVIGKEAATRPVVLLQLSWSAGDHIVARSGIKNLNELKGKKIAVQQGGPHVGLLYDSLTAAQLTKADVEIVWTKDITGANGPAEAFRKDESIGACCVITPDMIGLTSGADAVGSGAEGTVQGARVINSTAQMSRSIADVIAVRSDWYNANRDWCKKYVAGYLSATEKLVALRRGFDETDKLTDEYKQVLLLSQKILGAEFLPTLEADAHGLLLDCSFTGLPGQIAFFDDPNNLSNFDRKMTEAIDMSIKWGYAVNTQKFEPVPFSKDDYKAIASLGKIEYVEPKPSEKFESTPEATNEFFGDNLDENTIVSFAITFKPNQNEFPTSLYGADFMRALKAASTFGNARVVIRGHADPTKTLIDLVKAGLARKIIQQNGVPGNYKYYFQNKELDLEDTKKIVDLIKQGAFSGGEVDPNITMQAALTLSKSRADQVMKALSDFAAQSKVTLDLSQIAPVGAGIAEPLIAKPKDLKQAEQNMRVEFRIVKVNAEALAPSDFNF